MREPFGKLDGFLHKKTAALSQRGGSHRRNQQLKNRKKENKKLMQGEPLFLFEITELIKILLDEPQYIGFLIVGFMFVHVVG